MLDWFRFLKNNDEFFKYLENFIDENTVCVGISNTFLYPSFQNKKLSDSSGFSTLPTETKLDKLTAAAYSLYLWEYSNDELYVWFEKLRQLLDKYNPSAKIVLGGARSTRILQMSILAPKNYAVKHFVDYVICGMADNAMIQLIEKVKKKEAIKPSMIRGDINFIFCDRDEWKADLKQVPHNYYTKEDCYFYLTTGRR